MGAKNRYFVTQMESGGSNFFRFLITSLIFFLAMDVASSDRIKSSLVKTEEPSDGPDYKDIDVPAKYESNPNYDPMGLDWLYKITKNFIDLILKEAFPRDVVSITGDNNIEFNLEDHVSDVLGQYAYVLSLCLIILIFALAMFITGLIVTCCCCCGSGHESQIGKKNTGKKITLISLLIICGVLITVLGICALNSNQRLRDGVQEFPDDIQRSINDAKTFLDCTVQQIEILLIDNFKEFIDWITEELDYASDLVQKEIDDISKKLSIDEIFDIAENFKAITTDINEISVSTTKISDIATSLKNVKEDVDKATNPCPLSKGGCDNLRKIIDSLNFPVDVTIIDKPLKLIKNILSYSDEFDKGKVEFDTIKESLTKKIDDSKKQAEKEIEKAGNTMKDSVDKISSEIKKLKDYLPDKKSDDNYFLNKARDFVDNNEPYLYYSGVAICCIPLSIVGLLAVGMICGFGRTSFLEKTGSFLLLSGRTLMFYLTIVLAAITLIYFLVGVVIQQAVCKSLREPSESVFFEVVDQYDLSKFGLESTTVSTILKSILKGESAYKVFNLKSQFDLDTEVRVYLDQFKEALQKIESFAKDIEFDKFKMLTDVQIESLRKIKAPDLQMFEEFNDQLNTQIEKVDFDSPISKLQKIIDEIRKMENVELKNLLTTLESAKSELEGDKVEIGSLKGISDTVKDLEQKLKLGKDSFENGRDNLVDKIEKAQTYLVNDCPALFGGIAKNLGDKTYSVCEGYVNRVIHQTENDLGKSGPLGDVLDATLTSVCDKFALQMNSFWFVLLWTMLLFLPTVVISTKLASVYKSGMSHKPVETIRTPKGKKSKKTGGISEIPSGRNGFANNISGDFDDIILDKWEQYPPRPQAQHSRSQDEYTTPPPYFFPQLSTVSTPPRFDADRADELSKWEQFPPRPQAHNSRSQDEHTTPPPYLFPRWKEEYPESMKRSTKF